MSLQPSEKQWQKFVTDLADTGGWEWYHVGDSRRSKPGFPDLVLWHSAKKQVLFRELKTEKGVTSKDQKRVLASLACAGADTDIWRPSDESRVFSELLYTRSHT